MKTHYTYFIRNKLTRQRYIGVRTCNGDPMLDEYWGSCATLTEDIRVIGKHHFQKRILQTFATRKEAIQHEILLHARYNVSMDTKFYNVVKQTTTGFDNSGRKYKHKNPFTDEHRAKLSEAAKQRTGSKGSMYGKNHTEKTKEKIRQAAKTQENRVAGFKGKVHSAESLMKMSESGKGRKWFNNGVDEYLYFPGTEPDQYVAGRLHVCVPRSADTKKKIGKSKIGRKWFNNGKRAICCFPEKAPPGFRPGKKLIVR